MKFYPSRTKLAFALALISFSLTYGVENQNEAEKNSPSSPTFGRPQRPITPTPIKLTASTDQLTKSKWQGDFYSENRSLQACWAMDTLSLSAAHLVIQDLFRMNDDLLVLDVGCGDGSVTSDIIYKSWVSERGPYQRFIKPKFAYVTGIDPSEDMLKQSSKFTKLGELEFLPGAAQEIPFEDESFDIVTMFSAYHWVPRDQKEKAIQEIFRVLKPGGVMFCYTWVKHTDDKIRRAFEKTARTKKWFKAIEKIGFFEGIPNLNPFEKEEVMSYFFKEPVPLIKRSKIMKYLKRSGFEGHILEWQPHESDEVFMGSHYFTNWLLGWSQFGDLKEKHREFIEDVVVNYLEITGQQYETEIRYHDRKLRIVVQKPNQDI